MALLPIKETLWARPKHSGSPGVPRTKMVFWILRESGIGSGSFSGSLRALISTRTNKKPLLPTILFGCSVDFFVSPHSPYTKLYNPTIIGHPSKSKYLISTLCLPYISPLRPLQREPGTFRSPAEPSPDAAGCCRLAFRLVLERFAG